MPAFKVRFASGVLLALLLTLPCSLRGQSNSSDSLIQSLEAKDTNAKIARDIKPQDVIQWQGLAAEYKVDSQQTTITLQLSTKQSFTIYSDKLEWLAPFGFTTSVLSTPATSRQRDPISLKDVDVFTGGEFKVLLTGELPAEATSIDLDVKYVGCTQVICLFPYTQKISLQIARITGSTENPESSSSVSQSIPRPDQAPPTGVEGFEESIAKQVKAGSFSLGMLLIMAFVGGLLTNLTPCVAPMIPITVRLLGNQSGNPLIGSTLYALGIVLTYTFLGVIAAMSGALFGNLIAHPAVSISFGVVMALLGLSMLGFGDLSRLQQIGGRIGSGKASPINALLMGAGAGLVASPCTGPILAALLTYTAGRSSVLEATALLGVYSTGFALPYVFLGASAAKISKIRVHHLLQVSIKIIFAAVMFALSFYFLRIPLYKILTALQPYFGVLAASGMTIGIASMAWVIMSVDRQSKKSFLIIPAIALGIGLFSSIQTLTKPSTNAHDSVKWYRTESEAFAAAKASNKPILVDAWAEWCEACKKMDVTTFADPAVLEELESNWILLKLDLTESNDANAEIQDRYELPGLPTITLLPANADLSQKKALNGYVGPANMLNETKLFRQEKANN